MPARTGQNANDFPTARACITNARCDGTRLTAGLLIPSARLGGQYCVSLQGDDLMLIGAFDLNVAFAVGGINS